MMEQKIADSIPSGTYQRPKRQAHKDCLDNMKIENKLKEEQKALRAEEK